MEMRSLVRQVHPVRSRDHRSERDWAGRSGKRVSSFMPDTARCMHPKLLRGDTSGPMDVGNVSNDGEEDTEVVDDVRWGRSCLSCGLEGHLASVHGDAGTANDRGKDGGKKGAGKAGSIKGAVWSAKRRPPAVVPPSVLEMWTCGDTRQQHAHEGP